MPLSAQLATKLDSDWAALTVANIMPDPQTVQLAIRYAARLGRQNLASRLGEVALRKEEAFEEEEQDDHDGDADEEEQAVVDEIGDQYVISCLGANKLGSFI